MSVSQQYAAVLKDAQTEETVSRVIDRMKKKGHLSLLREIVKILEREDAQNETLVLIAKETDKNLVDNAIQSVAGDTNNARVKIDPRIVGGYVAKNKGTLRDNSIRKSLVTIYQKAVGHI